MGEALRENIGPLARASTGRPIFIQCCCWEELRSPYDGAEPQPSTGQTSCPPPWVQKFYPVLALGSGGKAPVVFPGSSSVLDKFRSAINCRHTAQEGGRTQYLSPLPNSGMPFFKAFV